MKQTRFEQDLMSVLSPVTWKTALELIRELRELWKRQDEKTILGNERDPSIAQTYITLEQLEKQRLVEKRYRDLSAKKLAERGGKSASEWCLTQQGRMMRAQQTSGTPTTDTRGLVPRPA